MANRRRRLTQLARTNARQNSRYWQKPSGGKMLSEKAMRKLERSELRKKLKRQEKYWRQTPQEAARYDREMNKLKKSWKKDVKKVEPPKVEEPVKKKKKKKHEPDYAGNIRNQYENSMASEASLNGTYFGQY